MENSQLIDFSCEDEFFVSDSPPNFRFSVTMENRDEPKNLKKFVSDKSAAEMFDKKAEKLLLSKSNASGRATNSRDSLAWDSAFFTSAGVLDPDELYVMNKGFEKAEVRKRKSTYSGYTLDADGFFLESSLNFEADLFQDVRESIKKSKTRTNMFPESHKQKNDVSKKLDYMSQTKVKPLLASQKQRVHKQGLERNKKGIANPSAAQASHKNTSNMVRDRSGKLKSFSPKPPYISGRANLTTSPAPSKDLILTKKSRLRKSSGSNSSISSLAEYKDSTSYYSPFASASSFRASSNSRPKTGSQKNKLSGSVSTFRTPVRCSLEIQNDLDNLNSSTYLSSLPNHSSYDSTASTIGKCDVESPSYTHMNSVSFIVAKGRRGKASIEESERGSKPSCLRKPSPKIGFFDKEHCSADFQFQVGSKSASIIKGAKAKTRPLISTPISSQDRRLIPSQNAPRCNSECKPVTSKSLKLPLNTIEKERKDRDAVRTIFGRLIKKEPLKNSPLSLEESKKENLSSFEEHVDGLSKYFEGISLRSKKIMGKLPNVFSKNRERTPLAEKKCTCNGTNK